MSCDGGSAARDAGIEELVEDLRLASEMRRDVRHRPFGASGDLCEVGVGCPPEPLAEGIMGTSQFPQPILG